MQTDKTGESVEESRSVLGNGCMVWHDDGGMETFRRENEVAKTEITRKAELTKILLNRCI